MKIQPILPGYLYAVDQVLPKELFDLIMSIDWLARPATRLEIGWCLRRQVTYASRYDQAVYDYCFAKFKQTIEHECSVKFTHPEQQSFQYWLDEPGFRPAMHTDGNLPSAIQIYLQASDRADLGTAFYRTADHTDLLHQFDSNPNTGYIMFNQPETDRLMLWHDMTQPVPEGVARLCLYLTLGSYQRR